MSVNSVDNPSVAMPKVVDAPVQVKVPNIDRLNLSGFSLVALDLDGTTLSPTGIVTPETRAAIQRLVSTGTRVCFATGRSYQESRSVLSQVEHYDLGVFVGGPMIVDTATGATVTRRHMNPALAAELVAFFENQGQPACALQDRLAAGVDYYITGGLALHESLSTWLEKTNAICRYVPVGQLPMADHANTLRVGVVVELDVATALQAALDAQFGQRIVRHLIVPTQLYTKPAGVLEVFDPTVTKWTGIQQIARHYGVSDTEVIAVGDDMNDLPMLRHAGLGVAMGNAVEEAKSAARLTIDSNADNGLAKFLERVADARQARQ